MTDPRQYIPDWTELPSLYDKEEATAEYSDQEELQDEEDRYDREGEYEKT